MNLANAWISEAAVDSDAKASVAGRRAIGLVEDLEHGKFDAAEVGLRVRHVLCQALTLARRWEPQGVHRFRSIADDLFRFGARVYAMYQPHFLNEFLSENVDRRG